MTIILFKYNFTEWFISKDLIDNKSALIPVTVWPRIGDIPFLEPLTTQLSDENMCHQAPMRQQYRNA